MKKMNVFGWKKLGAKWSSEDAYQALELLKENRIRCRMPSDDVYFISPFHLLAGPDRRWHILVRRRDWKRAEALLAREGLAGPFPVAEPPLSGPDAGSLLAQRETVHTMIYTGLTRSLPPSYSAR